MTETDKAWLFQNPNELPVGIYPYPVTWVRYGEELEKLALDHPRLFPHYKEGQYKDYANIKYIWQYEPGKHFDHWGCEWNNVVEGHDSICIGYPVKTLEDAKNIPIPEKDIGLEHGLIFLRYTYLRGYEDALIDLYEQNEIYHTLMEKVFLYAKRQTEIALEKSGGNLFINFADDLGMQRGLPTGPEVWRKTIGVWYEKLFAMCKERNKMIQMHTDGCIYEIIPDLRRYGLDVVNAQFRANGLENLKAVTRGSRYNRIGLLLDLDRQMFPVAAPDEIERHIWDCVNTLATPEGGLSLYAEIAEDIPLSNIQRIMEVYEKVIDYYR